VTLVGTEQPGGRIWSAYVHGLDDAGRPSIFNLAMWVPATWLPPVASEVLHQVGRRPGNGDKAMRLLLRTWPLDLTEEQVAEAHQLWIRYRPLTVAGWLAQIGCVRSQLVRLTPEQRSLCDLVMAESGDSLASAVELAQLTLPG
jgi:hypothetical protein